MYHSCMSKEGAKSALLRYQNGQVSKWGIRAAGGAGSRPRQGQKNHPGCTVGAPEKYGALPAKECFLPYRGAVPPDAGGGRGSRSGITGRRLFYWGGTGWEGCNTNRRQPVGLRYFILYGGKPGFQILKLRFQVFGLALKLPLFYVVELVAVKQAFNFL